MKRCPKCSETKPLADFFKNRARHDGLSGYCRPCQTTAANAHAAELRMRAMELLGGPRCKTCGFDDLRALVIDHQDGGGTQHRRKLVSVWRVLQDVLANPEKYQVLCHNCNWIKRAENGEHGRKFLTETVTL